MSHQVHTVRSDENLEAARKALETLGVHHRLVENRGEIVAIVSDRDVLRNLSPYVDDIAAQRRDEDTLRRPVYSIATFDLVSIDHTASRIEAAALMLEHGIARLPVRGIHETIASVVTKADLLQATLTCLVAERPAAYPSSRSASRAPRLGSREHPRRRHLARWPAR